MRSYLAGLLAALAATALWGFTFLGPAVVHPVNIYYLVVGRYAIFGLLSVVVLALNFPELRRLNIRGFLIAAHLGVVGYIGFYLLLSMSAIIGGGVLSSTLTGLIPAIVSLASNLITKSISWTRLLLPLLITSGGLLLVNLGSPQEKTKHDNGLLTGTLLGIGASLVWSYFVVANGFLVKKVPVRNSVWTASIGFGAFCGSLAIVPVAMDGPGSSPFAADFWYFLGWCAAFAILGSWCATWCWNIATTYLATTVLGPIIGMEAVFGALFNLIWQDRLPTVNEACGGALVVTGVFVCAYLFNKARITAHG